MGDVNEVEVDVCYLQKKIDETAAILRQKSIAFKYAEPAVLDARARYQLHARNLRHMKREADWVDLDDYKATIKNLNDARGEYDDAVLKASDLTTSITYFTAELASLKEKLLGQRRKHVHFCKILTFPQITQ